jgi:hypothetical protein
MAAYEDSPPEFETENIHDYIVKPSVCARYKDHSIHAYLKYRLFSQSAIDGLVGSIKRGELPYYQVERDRDSPLELYKSVRGRFAIEPPEITADNMHATTLVSFHVHVVSPTDVRIHLIPTITNPFTFVQDSFTLPDADIRGENGLIHVYVRKLVSEIYAISRIKPFTIGQMFTVSYDIVFNRSVDTRGGDFHRDNSKFGTNFNFLSLEFFMDEDATCFSPELIAAFPPRIGGQIILPDNIYDFLRDSPDRKDFRMLAQDATIICFDNLYCVHATPEVFKRIRRHPDGRPISQITYHFPPHQVTRRIRDPKTGEIREITTIVHRRADEKTRAAEELYSSTPKNMSQSQSQGSDLEEAESSTGVASELAEEPTSFAIPNGVPFMFSPEAASRSADIARYKRPEIAITKIDALDYEDPFSGFNPNKRSEFVEGTSAEVLAQFVDDTRLVRRSFLRGSWYLTTETMEMIASTGPIFPIPPEWTPIPVIVFQPLDETQHLLGGAGAGAASPHSVYKMEGTMPLPTVSEPVELPNLLIKYDNMFLINPFDTIPATKKGVDVYLQKEQEFIRAVNKEEIKNKPKKGGRKYKKSNKNKKTKKRSKKQTRKQIKK